MAHSARNTNMINTYIQSSAKTDIEEKDKKASVIMHTMTPSLPSSSSLSTHMYAMAFKLSVTVDLCIACNVNYVHFPFDDLDLAATSQCVGRGKISPLNYLDN